MIFSSVLLPDPLRPISPSICPRGTSNETFLTASKSWKLDSCRKNLENSSRIVSGRSWMTRKRWVTFSNRIGTELEDIANSDVEHKIILILAEDGKSDEQADKRADERSDNRLRPSAAGRNTPTAGSR